VSVDNRVPYYVYANMQDDDAERGPAYPEATPLLGGVGEPNAGWQEPLGGCESGFIYPDPADADVIWATCYGDEITRLDTKVGYPRAVSPWPLHPLDSPPEDLKYRCHWTPPMAIDPFDDNTVYYGCQVIFKTTDGGQSWKVISPDLSTQDPKYLVPSGGIPVDGKMRRQDNLGQFYGELVFAIAPSPAQQGLIWADPGWRRQLDQRHQAPVRPAAIGSGHAHRAFALRRRYGLRVGGPCHDRRLQALYLQDHEFRTQLEAHRAWHCGRPHEQRELGG
jgi:hypothetical protein